MTLRAKSTALATTGLGVLLSAGLAFAQADNSNVETVIVTGTRIPTTEAESPSPIQSIGAAEIQNSGTLNLTDYLKRIPALAGSIGDLQESD